MTVANSVRRADTVGNGSTKVFAIPFYFISTSHIKITLVDVATAVETPLALTTNYTITGVGNPNGGVVTMKVAYPATKIISILRDIPLSQLTHYVDGDPFPAASHENALDLLTMINQQQQEELDRTLKAPTGAAGFSGTLPPLVPGSYLAVNAAGTGFTFAPSIGPSYAPSVFENNDDAIAAGLPVGVYYRNSEGTLKIVFSLNTPAISVAMSPANVSVFSGASVDLTASVLGTDAKAVTWDVDGIAGGSAAYGVITGTGNTVSYRAPTGSSPHVATATSVTDPTKSASCAITVLAVPAVYVALNTNIAQTVVEGGTKAFSAVVGGLTDTSLTWTVDGVSEGDATTGLLTGTGLSRTYTAPAAGGGVSHLLTVASVVDTTKTASCEINVQAAAVIEETAFVGFGHAATGGAGNQTVHVTNTNDSGTGSFRTAVAGGNRIVVFDVGGTINLTSLLDLPSNITVDGSTAPSPGVTFTGRPIRMMNGVNNIILKNFRHRGGWSGGQVADCISMEVGSHNIVLDHLSLSGYYDEAIGTWNGIYDLTVQNCLLGAGGNPSHSYAFLMGNLCHRLSCYHNLIAGTEYRNPAVGWDDANDTIAPSIVGDVVNNLIWGYTAYGTTVYWGGKANVVGNYYQTSAYPNADGRALNIEGGGSAYSNGNYSKDGSGLTGNAGSPFAVTAAAQITATSAADAAAYCLANAGCRIGGLDATDTAIVNAITAAGL